MVNKLAARQLDLREQGCQRRAGSPVGRDAAALPVQARLCPRVGAGAGCRGSLGPAAKPELPREVLDLLDYPDRIRKGSNLEPLESVSLDDLDADWENLQRQLQDEADAARWAGEERGMALGSTYTRVHAGRRVTGSVREANGTGAPTRRRSGTGES